MAAAARGRGRGRGGFGVPKPGKSGEKSEQQADISTEKSSNEFDLTKVLNDLGENTLDTQVKEISHHISQSSSSTKLKDVVDHLIQRTIKKSDFAPLAAKVANKLCSDESFGIAFRGDLLKSTQEQYKKRESIRANSTSEWIGLACFICELFRHLRTGEAPLRPLAAAVHQTLSELLSSEGQNGNNDEELEGDEIDCFYENFKGVGFLLETVNQEKAEELLGMMRDTILSDNSSAKTRCLLLEMLEFHARQGKISSKVEDYFSDKLAEIMANEL
nr:MIF4G domain-containing protein B-like [Pocillopora verrucosa]